MRPFPANSSDLGLAAALARHLAVRAPDREPEPAPVLSFPRLTPPRDAAGGRSESEVVSELVHLELETWEAFLAWSLELSRSRAAFVVDSQGFVIASRGALPSGDFTATGAELCYTMGQLESFDHASGKLQALELQFDGYRLLGLRVLAESDGPPFILGLVGSRPIGDELRRGIVRQLLYCLPHLS